MNIFELEGIFSGPRLQRSKQEISGVLTRCPSEGLLFNVCALEKIDPLGAQVILDAVRSARKGGILGRNLSTYFAAEPMKPNAPLPIFETASEAIEYFGREMAQSEGNTLRKGDRRYFKRTMIAFPIELKWQGEGNPVCFEAVGLNLSEGGFCGRFIDNRTEAIARKVLDPFDLKMLSFRLILPNRFFVETQGKVLRTDERTPEPGTIAVEFYDLHPEERRKINVFLEQTSVE